MPLVSLIIPVLNESENIVPLYHEIRKYAPEDFEIIFVDDGSTDTTFTDIQQLALSDDRIKCLSLSRNFGHQNAFMAGMEYANGRFIITMDGDLQDPPSLIPAIINQLNEGYDIVFTKRSSDENITFFKRFYSKCFYMLMSFLSDTKIEPGSADYKGFTYLVRNAILQFSERDLFLRGMFTWIGFSKTYLVFSRPGRLHGTTKFSYSKMIKLGLSAATSFSFKPLRVSLMIGSIISLIAFGLSVYYLIAYLNGNTIQGWTSLILTSLFLGGIQLLVIGLLGEYIAGMFIELKKRPLYIVKKSVNIE